MKLRDLQRGRRARGTRSRLALSLSALKLAVIGMVLDLVATCIGSGGSRGSGALVLPQYSTDCGPASLGCMVRDAVIDDEGVWAASPLVSSNDPPASLTSFCPEGLQHKIVASSGDSSAAHPARHAACYSAPFSTAGLGPSNLDRCDDAHCAAVEQKCASLGAKIASRNDFNAYMTDEYNDPNTLPTPYGLTSDLQPGTGKRYFYVRNKPYGWEKSCCGQANRYTFCTKQIEETGSVGPGRPEVRAAQLAGGKAHTFQLTPSIFGEFLRARIPRPLAVNKRSNIPPTPTHIPCDDAVCHMLRVHLNCVSVACRAALLGIF